MIKMTFRVKFKNRSGFSNSTKSNLQHISIILSAIFTANVFVFKYHLEHELVEITML